jgi:ribose transport system ATP-binding protein
LIRLSARGISKSYGSPVLRDVHLDLGAGEVHALIGENGAGKSTLSRIFSGVTRPDAGMMLLDGTPYAPESRSAAEAGGVGIVFQEINVVRTLSVAEQVLFGSLPSRFGIIDAGALRVRSRELLGRVGLEELDPDRQMGSLGVGVQQLVAVAAGLSRRHAVLILDEPTAALSEGQAAVLFERIAELRAEGCTVVYISHRLDEVLQIADRVSVLRDGRLVATRLPVETSRRELIELMVGRTIGTASPSAAGAGEVVLRVRGLRRPPSVHDVSFEVRRGEIVGLAGLMGSGRTETVRALCGADRAAAGEVELKGRRIPPFHSPHDAVAEGVALVTENRKEEGLLLPLPIGPNITLATLRRFVRAGFVRRRTERTVARTWSERLGISVRSLDGPVQQLSGGNQQKVVLARWLERDLDVLVCDEPTRGIDVAARFEIHQLLLRLAREGKAILIVSSELEELIGLCHRIVVLSLGRVTAEFSRAAFDRTAILHAALEHHRNRPGTAEEARA